MKKSKSRKREFDPERMKALIEIGVLLASQVAAWHFSRKSVFDQNAENVNDVSTRLNNLSQLKAVA
jgi:hypothetical protein